MTKNKKHAIFYATLGSILSACAISFFIKGNIAWGLLDTTLAISDFGWAYFYLKEG